MKVLIAHSHPVELQLLAAVVEQHGFDIDTCNSGLFVLERAAAFGYGLLICDATLPGAGVPKICRWLRHSGVYTPVLVLVDQSIPEIVAALDAGADSCLARPFGPEELMARVRALLRRNRALSDDRWA
jgi:DNA-binding response OmpR family regulator